MGEMYPNRWICSYACDARYVLLATGDFSPSGDIYLLIYIQRCTSICEATMVGHGRRGCKLIWFTLPSAFWRISTCRKVLGLFEKMIFHLSELQTALSYHISRESSMYQSKQEVKIVFKIYTTLRVSK